MGRRMELYRTSDVEETGRMTDKEFVLSLYPNAKFYLTSYSDRMFLSFTGDGKGSHDFETISTPPNEEAAWKVARNLIDQRMLNKLGS
jgi:hypothetical protein